MVTDGSVREFLQYNITMVASEQNNNYAVGADIGGSHICSAVVDLTTGGLCSEPVVTNVDSRADATAIIGAWQSNICTTVKAFGKRVANVGLAIPGPFDYENGVSLIAGVDKYENIYGLDVRLSLAERLYDAGIRNLRFVNDASAFALGECLGGAARNDSRVVALTLGTGVGSGFVAEHRLVESGDEVPYKGWVYHLPFETGIVDDAFSTRWVCRRYFELTGENVAGAKEIALRCDSGDDNARRLFDEYGRRMGEFVLPLLKRFSSHTLLLGGNISLAYRHFGPSLERTFKNHGYNVDVRVSALLDRAALIGAASLFI